MRPKICLKIYDLCGQGSEPSIRTRGYSHKDLEIDDGASDKVASQMPFGWVSGDIAQTMIGIVGR